MKKKILLLLVTTILMSIITACDLSDDTMQSDDDKTEESNDSESKEDSAPVLTVDNCPELEAVLYSKDASGSDFASKYNGRYVEFEACIYKNSKDSITQDRTITVTGEFSAEGEASGWVIMIGNRTWGAHIDESVEKGDLVVVKGRVDADWTEYYGCLYIETESLSKKE